MPTKKPLSIVRTKNAGVFFGELVKRSGDEAQIKNARRLWYWAGAASLSQLSVDGTSRPSDCKFPCEVPEITVLEVIEVLPVSEKAEASIKAVPVWQS